MIRTRHIPFETLASISLSTRQDDFVVLHVAGSYDSLLQVRDGKYHDPTSFNE